MAGNNEAPKNPSSKENKEVKNTSSQKELDPKVVIEKFIENRMQNNILYFSSFSQTNNFWGDFESYLKSHAPEYVESFKKMDLQTMLSRLILETSKPLENIFSNVEKKFEKEYIFDSEKQEKLATRLQHQAPSTLKYLMYSNAWRAKFLKKEKIFSLEELQTTALDSKDDEKILQSVFESIDVKIFKEDADKLQSLKQLMFAKNVNLHDVRNLFSWLHWEQKKALVQYFIPTISLWDALEIGILNEKQVKENIKNQVLGKIQESDMNDFLKNVDKKSYFIDTKNLEAASLELVSQSEKYLSKIVKEFTESRAYVVEKESLLGKEEFFEAVHDNSNISSEIKANIHKCEIGAHYSLKTENTTQYFVIQALTQEGFEVTNVKNGKWVTHSDKRPKEHVSYINFMELLEVLSKKDATTKIEFLNTQDFTQLSLEELPEIEDIDSVEKLTKILDEVDPKGKGIPVDKMAFFYENTRDISEEEKKKLIFTDHMFFVTKVDASKKTVSLSSGEEISFTDFAYAFQEKKPKRFLRIDDKNHFLESMKGSENYKETWKDLEIKDGKIIPKSEKENKDFGGVEYFIWEKGESIKITKLGGGTVSFEEGKYKEWNQKSEKEKERNDTFDRDWGRKATVSYTVFFHYLQSKKLKPKLHPKNVQDSNENIEELKTKRGFFKSWFSCLSIKEMMAGMKQVWGAVEHYLEQGNKLKSAQFALAMGKFLPEWVRRDLQNIVEGEQKKTMEEIMDKLKSMNSTEMIETIQEYIKTSRPGDPKLEACLMTMVGKYGNLYNKMESKRGSFMWYQALWGKVWDALYEETKRNCLEATLQLWEKNKSQAVPFTEELLVEELLKKQVKPESPYYPKRRSKFDKDYWGALKWGMREEMEDWENKAWDMFTIKWRLDYAIGEFKNGWYANGVGAFEKVLGKWGSALEMNAIPFAVIMSGIPQKMNETLLKEFFLKMRDGPYAMGLLCSNPTNMKVFQSTVARLIELTGTSDMKKAFKEAKWVKEIYEFWMTYGETLASHLNLSSHYILKEKDKSGNEDLASYYDTYVGMMTDNEYNMKDDDISNGKYDHGEHEINPTVGKKYYEYFFKLNTAWWFSNTARSVFDTTMKQIKALKENSWTLEEKFTIYKEFIKYLEPAIRKGAESNLTRDTFRQSNIALNLKSVWLDMIDDLFSTHKFDAADDYTESGDFQEYTKKCFDRFMNQKSFHQTTETLSNNVILSTNEILAWLKTST